MTARQIALLLALSAAPLAQAQKPLPYLDPSLPIPERVDDLVGRMTLEEKVGQTIDVAPAIERLGVPAYNWWNEGLHGVARSGNATVFPQAIGMAATWDVPLIEKIGDTISTEARAKYNDALARNSHERYYGLTIWSPNINIFRDPRWGRGQETYGEDPFLTAHLGMAFVRGLQGNDPKYFKVIATPKHFAVHSGPESTRHLANIDPTPHDLWDTYLPAFRALIVDAHADSIMCAYNAVDGAPACGSKMLLGEILRRDWNFQGFVTSDCGAIDDFYKPNTHKTSPDKEAAAAAGIKAGTDTNCGNTYLALTAAVKRGDVTEAEIDTSVRRLFTARYRLGMFDPAASVPWSSLPMSVVENEEHRALAAQAADKSMVLLKNDGVLPLKPGVRTIAVVGPNAASLAALEGNYNAIARDPVLPVDAVAAEFPHAKVVYAQGSPYDAALQLPVPRTAFHTGDAEGLKAEYFPGGSFYTLPTVTRVDKQIDFDWMGASPAPGLPIENFAVRWTGTITAPEAGPYPMNIRLHCEFCSSQQTFAVYLDGLLATTSVPVSGKTRQTANNKFTIDLPDTKPHALRVDYVHTNSRADAGITLEWNPPTTPLLNEAVAVAKKADVVLAFVGLSRDLEGEEMPIHVDGFAGGDRTDIKLPAAQQTMLEALVSTGKPVVVVLMNGSALAVNWAQEHAAAILEGWYPGEEGGRAIARTLSGKNNPAGRLPVTFYAGVDQIPAFDDYGMSGRTYRYFKGQPLYGFGYGLSYTTFQYSNVKLSTKTLKAGDTLTVEADVRNTGTRAGDEVAELYLTPPTTAVSPARALDGFQRIHLAPGAVQHVSFQLDPRTLSQVDVKGDRSVTPGEYKVFVGGAQPTAASTPAIFSITGSQTLPH
ncbi:beta-glucosidase [Granulicella pectinivorans]|uniref:Beta-glucosidase n=1 Tax=Granulicella pectinivorans TaxID=474950 RepID=A0A1I6LTS5_9BACT|nr:glycoside hydrolase family 3 C-terminal domain-containing protein [Granulicella pectinivorans]SFS06887.1 beta-glucosidase [Granulicella pectinivorans]